MLLCHDSRDLFACCFVIQKAQLLAEQAEANAGANGGAGGANGGMGAAGAGGGFGAGGAGGLGAGYGSANMTSRIAMSAKEAFRRRNDLLTALEVTNLTSS